jgi:hypothetical protein
VSQISAEYKEARASMKILDYLP